MAVAEVEEVKGVSGEAGGDALNFSGSCGEEDTAGNKSLIGQKELDQVVQGSPYIQNSNCFTRTVRSAEARDGEQRGVDAQADLCRDSVEPFGQVEGPRGRDESALGYRPDCAGAIAVSSGASGCRVGANENNLMVVGHNSRLEVYNKQRENNPLISALIPGQKENKVDS